MSDEAPREAGAGEPADATPVDEAQRRKAARRARQVKWGVRLGLVVLRLLAATWRVRALNAEPYLARRRAAKPFVFAFWHGGMLPLLWRHRGEQAAVLVSLHKDGEIIARICQALGFRTVRGSTTRGGGRALLGLVRELEAGHEVAVTPDGPKGPRHHFAPGALMAAQRAKVPIVPIGVHCPSAWQLKSWDRFMIPRPFARVTVVYGDPAFVAGSTPREATEETARFEEIMRVLEGEAQQAAARA